MASKSNDYSSCSSSGWEMIPYTPLTPLLDPQMFNVDHRENTEFCSNGLESVVQEGMAPSLEKNVQSPDPKLPQTTLEPQGLESVEQKETLPSQVEKDVLTPDPVSVQTVQLPRIVPAVPQGLLPQTSGIQKSRRGKRLCNSKILGVSNVSFDLIRLVRDPDTYLLVMHDSESSREVEEIPGVKDESRLPQPHLLKRWLKETRQRPSGARDKFYSHSTTTRLFRSVIEMVNYIKTNNNLQDAKLKDKSENKLLQGYKGYKNISEASFPSSNDRKRKFCNLAEKLTFKKTREQETIEEFFASAHQNLMKLRPPVPMAQGITQNRSALQGYFGLTNEKIRNFLDGNGNGNGNGNHQHQSRADVEAWINELLNK